MLKIIKPGLLTTIQDLGRTGYRHHGVVSSGAMDRNAHRIANWLLGNNESSATLEITLMGPIIEAQEDALVAITGADLSPTIFGKPIANNRPIFLKKGSIIHFDRMKRGCRAYLAIGGGINVPKVMNSRSTDLRAKLGGYHGRSLATEDILYIGKYSEHTKHIISHLRNQANQMDDFYQADWSVGRVSKIDDTYPIRVMKGRQFDWFTKESQASLVNKQFRITAASNRMGYRLDGNKLSQPKSQEMISEAVRFGTVQVPSDGNPIVLMADSQTTGGYPKIAEVATVDLPRLAQKKPGDMIDFTWITHKEAEQLLIKQEREMKQLLVGVQLRSYR